MPAPVSRRKVLAAAASAAVLHQVLPGSAGAVTGTAKVTVDVLNLRSGPGTSNSVIGRMTLNQVVQVLEGPNGGWYRVVANGVTGWASGDYLVVTPDASTPPTGTTAKVTTSILNLRSGPATTYGVIGKMPLNTVVSVLEGPSGGWYKVVFDGTQGWASGDYLTVTPGGSAPPTGSDTATVNVAKLNLRSGPSTSYSVLTVLNQGQIVTIVTAPSGGWAQVTAAGTTGWVASTYLTMNGSTSAQTATVATDVLNLRSGASTSTSVTKQMLYGETVEIESQSGDWYRGTYHGTSGYAFGPYLRFGGPSASMWVPTHQQKHNLSCEYASCQIATAGLGNEIDENRFIPIIGTNPNPHVAFRGNIDGTFIYGYEDYGIYPEPLVPALAQFGFVGTILTGGKDELVAELAAHHPVVLWIDLGYTSSFMMDIGGQQVLMATQSHVVCGYGYNDEGVLISDPDSSRRKRVIGWNNFMRMWNSMAQMALAVRLP
ncbi:MAG: SH3 domain-containing protein [Thermomicrobiales bacterium]|nr:SH3 domain-containing protein [Thermomicrobiales bacterium]